MSTAAGAAGPDPEPDGEAVTRRAPFSANPTVGARGQRTQQRILDAALEVFGEVGYHQCSIDRVAKTAGCSRISFYQYFSGKEDVFRHLGRQVLQQIAALGDGLGPVTPDEAGWSALRDWVAGYDEVHQRFAPVFAVFQAALSNDESIARPSQRAGDRNVARFRARMAPPALPARRVDGVTDLALKTTTAAFGVAATLRRAHPEAWPHERVDDALADILHRSLFGLMPDVNVHAAARRRPPRVPFGPAMQEVLDTRLDGSDLTPAGRRTLDALLDAGRTQLVTRGYHGTRVDDIATAADLSHGAFYRYFENKDQFARLVAGQAMRTVSLALTEIPVETVHDGAGGRDALREWLRRYNAAQSTETALVRVWADATAADPALRAESAAVFDWGRRRMAGFLQPRGFGDVDTEAVAMLALLEAYGARPRDAAATDTAALLIEQGFLGRPAVP
ncbi:MAG: TetR/AcrR family transcriptional regulator [Acidimicrobiales bacterium]|nr:TetR/AcrR family transcriptional regulator [Acidimicrobiales bacterium]